MDHLTWPDVAALVVIAAMFTTVFYFIARNANGVPATFSGDLLLHRERMADKRRKTAALGVQDMRWSTQPISESVYAGTEVLNDLIKAGAAQKQPDGSYSFAFEKHADGTVRLIVHGKPVSPPEPEAKAEA